MSWVKSRLEKVPSFVKMNRQSLTLLIILSFIGFIIFTSFGGSQTGSFGDTENQPIFQDDPTNVNLPAGPNGFNGTDFEPPSNLNPPGSAIGDIGNLNPGGNIPDIDAPPSDPSGGLPDLPSGSPGIPDVPNGQPPTIPPGGGGGDIDFPDFPDGGGGIPDFPGGGGSDSPNDPFSLPDRPNKAENLWNLTGIVLFPNTTFAFEINIQFPSIEVPEFSNGLFLLTIFSILYLPHAVVTRLLGTVFPSKRDEEASGSASSIFFKPEKTETEIRREKQRQKRLRSFSDYLDHIITQIEERQHRGISPKNIITWSYLSIDEAFTHFMALRRDKDLTPLEHAQLNFEDHEIDNASLQEIVSLFYLTRFGNKELSMERVEELKKHIKHLVPRNDDSNYDVEGRKWGIF